MSIKPKLISKNMLAGDEKVVFESRPSGVKYMTGGSIALLFALIFLLISIWTELPWDLSIPFVQEYLEGEYGWMISIAALALFVLLTMIFIVKWMKWSSTIYVITDERVITKRGLINRTFEDMPLGMIASVDLSQKASQGFLGYGDVIFSTQGGTGRSDVIWKSVPNPLRVRKFAQEVMDYRPKL